MARQDERISCLFLVNMTQVLETVVWSLTAGRPAYPVLSERWAGSGLLRPSQKEDSGQEYSESVSCSAVSDSLGPHGL